MSAREWDIHYQSGAPPWETGQPSAELGRVIAEKKIRPCRAIELGCGTGINAVWLARQEFEVMAVDFNALAIDKARSRAAAAGVEVRFLLADVLNLGDREQQQRRPGNRQDQAGLVVGGHGYGPTAGGA